MAVTLGELLAALSGVAGPTGGFIALGFVIWLLGFSDLVITRRHHKDVVEGRDKIIDSERKQSAELLQSERAHYEAIIKLKDERILIAEGEAEQWKRQALAKEGVRQRQSRGPG